MTDFEKRLNKTPNHFIKWWNKNGYKVMRIIFFPVWICCLFYDKYEDYSYQKITFSEEKAKKYLDKYLPETLSKDENDGTFWFCYEWRHIYNPKGKRDKIFDHKFYYDINKYLLNSYEVEGFSKQVEKDPDEIWIGFKKNT